MKFVKFRVFPGDAEKGERLLTTRDFIRGIVENPAQGANLSEIRKRTRILDALEKAEPTGVTLEDADHATLKAIVEDPAQRFIVVNRHLLQICEDIIDAKAPPAPQLPPKADDASAEAGQPAAAAG